MNTTFSIIEAAHTAIDSSIVKGDKPQESGKLQNKSVVHWSYTVTSIATIIGVVIAVAAYVLGNVPLALLGIVLGVTNGLGSFYLKKFSIADTLEGLVKELTS